MPWPTGDGSLPPFIPFGCYAPATEFLRAAPARLLSAQRNPQAGNDQGGDVPGPDHGAVAAKAGDRVLGYLEGEAPACVPAGLDQQSVLPGLDWYLNRRVWLQRRDLFAIDGYPEWSLPQLDAEAFSYQPERR